MRKFVLGVALLVAGIAAAVALADTTGTVSVCSAASVPAYTAPTHTVNVDGSPVATVGGDVNPAATDTECATTTYTVPTVTNSTTATQTVTTTVPGPTTTVTTTVPATSPSYATATAYTQNPPAFTPTRTVNVTDGASLKAAISGLQAGDLVKASAPFTYTSSSTSSSALTLSARPASMAVIDLTGVSIVEAGGAGNAAFYIRNASNVRIYNGDISTTGTGMCIDDVGSQNVLWWGFNVHDCGASGVAMIPGLGAIDHSDFQGSVTRTGLDYLVEDPHSEKGTGVHGVLLWDANNSTYGFTNNRLAFDVQNIKHGGCIELGSDYNVPAGGNTLVARCDGNPCVATSQTCGNGLELWGYTTALGLDVKYLEVNNYAGYAIETALRSGQNLNGVNVEYGRATNDMTNPYPKGLKLWDAAHGETFGDVLPAP